MQEYRELISENGIADLDVGILCLNAGVVGHTGCIDLMEDEDYETIWRVNILHGAFLLKCLAK